MDDGLETRIGTLRQLRPGGIEVTYRPPSVLQGALMFMAIPLLVGGGGLLFNFGKVVDLVRSGGPDLWIILGLAVGGACVFVIGVLGAVLVLRSIHPPQRLLIDTSSGSIRVEGKAKTSTSVDRVREVVLVTETVFARGARFAHFYLTLVSDDGDLTLPIGGGRAPDLTEQETSHRIARRVAAALDRPLAQRER